MRRIANIKGCSGGWICTVQVLWQLYLCQQDLVDAYTMRLESPCHATREIWIAKFLSFALSSTAVYASSSRAIRELMDRFAQSSIISKPHLSFLPYLHLMFLSRPCFFPLVWYLNMFTSCILVVLHGRCNPLSISAACYPSFPSTRQHLQHPHHQPDPPQSLLIQSAALRPSHLLILPKRLSSSIKAHLHCFAFQQPMFSPFQPVRFDRGRMIRVPDEEQEHTSKVHNLRMEKKALRNQLDSLVSDNTNLRRAHDRLSRQIAELKKQLEISDRDRINVARKNRELSAQITGKNQAYHDLCIDYNMLDDEIRSLCRSRQQPNRQSRRY